MNREEIFGPVVTITPFDSEEEVIGYANDTDYGLASSVWTQNLSRAHRVAEQIHTGTVWVNCWLVRDLRVPFGGMKQSGVGREGGEEALRFFTSRDVVCKYPFCSVTSMGSRKARSNSPAPRWLRRSVHILVIRVAHDSRSAPSLAEDVHNDGKALAQLARCVHTTSDAFRLNQCQTAVAGIVSIRRSP